MYLFFLLIWRLFLRFGFFGGGGSEASPPLPTGDVGKVSFTSPQSRFSRHFVVMERSPSCLFAYQWFHPRPGRQSYCYRGGKREEREGRLCAIKHLIRMKLFFKNWTAVVCPKFMLGCFLKTSVLQSGGWWEVFSHVGGASWMGECLVWVSSGSHWIRLAAMTSRCSEAKLPAPSLIVSSAWTIHLPFCFSTRRSSLRPA